LVGRKEVILAGKEVTTAARESSHQRESHQVKKTTAYIKLQVVTPIELRSVYLIEKKSFILGRNNCINSTTGGRKKSREE